MCQTICIWITDIHCIYRLGRGWANTSGGQITWPWAKIMLTPRKILIFWIENLIFWIENLIFWIENLIFWTDNLIYWTYNLIIWTDNLSIERETWLCGRTTWFFRQELDCLHKKLILRLSKLIYVLIIGQETWLLGHWDRINWWGKHECL